MVRIRVKLGSKGQVVIPKVIRESIGLRENQEAVIEVREKYIEIRPVENRNIAREWREIAHKHGGDLAKMKFVYGDKLYEDIFK